MEFEDTQHKYTDNEITFLENHTLMLYQLPKQQLTIPECVAEAVKVLEVRRKFFGGESRLDLL